jgi:hypothetical protein
MNQTILNQFLRFIHQILIWLIYSVGLLSQFFVSTSRGFVMNTWISRRFGFVAVAAFCCWFSWCGSADADWSDNFNGGLQQTWNFGNLDGSQAPSGSFQAGSVNNTLVLTDPTTAQFGGAAIGFGWVAEQFTDVTVSATLNPLAEGNLNGFVGLVARADFSTLSGYVLTYNPITGAVDLVSVAGGVQTGLDSANIGGGNDSLFISLTIVGDQLTGRVFDAPGGTLLGEVTAIDSEYGSGVSGVVVQISDGAVTTPVRGTWDNVSSVVANPGFVLGDANGDGNFDFGDIEAFFLAITDPAAYALAYPNINPNLVLDFDGDMVASFGDIEGFFVALTSGGG